MVDGHHISQLNRWTSPLPVGGVLVRIGHVQDRLLRARFSPDLETEGEILRGEAAAYAQRGRTGQAESDDQAGPIAMTALLRIADRNRNAVQRPPVCAPS